MPELTTVIGPKGSGKNIFSVWAAKYTLQYFPNTKVVSNFEIDGCFHSQDIQKTWAMKILLGDKRPQVGLMDEAGMSGFEARQSRLAGSEFPTYLLAVSRKFHIDIFDNSQLMSQIEKRMQWLSDRYILCKAIYKSDQALEWEIPDWFHYTIFNEDLKVTGQKDISSQNAVRYMMPYYDTEEIPFSDKLLRDFESYFQIQKDDMQDYIDSFGMYQAMEDPYSDWKKARSKDDAEVAAVVKVLGQDIKYVKVANTGEGPIVYQRGSLPREIWTRIRNEVIELGLFWESRSKAFVAQPVDGSYE